MSVTSRWKTPFQTRKRERQQPSNRESFGFLEKKKDYKKRAEQVHKKEKFIADLKREAAQRNPDEFYFSMITDTKNRELQTKSKPPRKFTKEQRMLLEDGDQLYIQSKLTTHTKKLMALREKLPVKPQKSVKICATVEEAMKLREAEPDEKEETPEIKELRDEIEQREKIVRQLQEVLDELQLRKDLKHGDVKRVEDDEGNASYVWKQERKK